MKVIVVYDGDGKIAAMWEKDENASYNYMETEIPDGMLAEGVDLIETEEGGYPEIRLRSSDEILAEEATAEEHRQLVQGIRDRVAAGGDLRTLIGELPLSNSEKWDLEEEVKNGI